MNYLKLQVPPGVRFQGTAYQCADRWHDANLMRWDQGAMLPVGGWANFYKPKEDGSWVGPTKVQIPSEMVPREAHSWFAKDGAFYLAVATPTELYVMDGLGALTELTADLSLPGAEMPFFNKGYGGGKYGAGQYGLPRQLSDLSRVPASTWTLDNYGSDLIGVSTTDKHIYRWQPDEDGQPFLLLDNAPRCSSLVATEERFIFALSAMNAETGKLNPRRIAWCDRENPTDWEVTATNEAGGFELQTDGAIRCGIRVRGRTLILTTTDAHVALYSGPPLVYGFQQVGKNCGVVSDRAVAATGAGAFWMGRDGFYTYDGSAVRELPCEVSDRVFRFMDKSNWQNIFAVANAKFNEITWFYPDSTSEGVEVTIGDQTFIRKVNNRYVTYDYAQNIWSIGAVNRHAGVDSGIFDDPLWLDAEGYVWRHEIENAGYGGLEAEADEWQGWTCPKGGCAAFSDNTPPGEAFGYSYTGGTKGDRTEMFYVSSEQLSSVDPSVAPFHETGAKMKLKNLFSVPWVTDNFYNTRGAVEVEWALQMYWANDGAVPPGGLVADLYVRENGKVIHHHEVRSVDNRNSDKTVRQKFIIRDPRAEIEVEWVPSEHKVNGFIARSQSIDYLKPIKAWAETGPISIGSGDQVMQATQVLTDAIPEGRMDLEFMTKFEPQGDEIIFGPYPVKPKTDVRFTGRQMRMRTTVHRDETGVNDVRIGDMRVLVSGGGRR